MPDLLTHALVAYGLGTLVTSRAERLSSHHVTLAMIGAMLPDLNHISVLLSGSVVELTLGVPFDWDALQTGGPVLLLVLIGTVLATEDRPSAFGFLSLGALSHLLADMLITLADGRSQSVFWPATRYQPPSPGLYLSTNLEPLLTALLFAGVVWWFSRPSRRDGVEQTD